MSEGIATRQQVDAPDTEGDRPAIPTEEEVKDCVRRYCEGNFPGWECAAVSVRVGPVLDAKGETLLVLPTRSSVPSDPIRGAF
jgi:hypothetical protein